MDRVAEMAQMQLEAHAFVAVEEGLDPGTAPVPVAGLLRERRLLTKYMGTFSRSSQITSTFTDPQH